MRSDTRPMPPTGKLGDETIAIFSKWVSAGLPRGSCADTAHPDPGPDPDPDPPPDDGNDDTEDSGPPPPQSLCTSGVTSPEMPDVLEEMNSGKACIACHNNSGQEPFLLGGTVFPTLHEPDRCYGAKDLRVVVIDRTGNAHNMTTNAAGNFFTLDTIEPPYRAMVVRGNDIRMMATPQTDPDCNGCHSEWGNGAPGRIMAP
jgi:hypothetical protein